MIDVEQASYPVAWMCQLLGVPRSSFYGWRNKAETPTGGAAASLPHVRRVVGCRRVVAQPNRNGTVCSVGLVADLMREAGLRAC